MRPNRRSNAAAWTGNFTNFEKVLSCRGRAFEVRWTCTCCHERAVFNCYSFCHFLISVFLCFIGGVEKHQYRGTSPVCRQHIFNTVLDQLPAASIPLSIRRLIDSQNGLSPCTTLNAHSTLANSQHQHQAPSWWHHDALVRCRHAQWQPFRALQYSKKEPQRKENERKGKWEHECVFSFLGWLLPTLHGFFLAPDFNDRMSDHD